jgi:CO/xanthine dehydrogenase FAD-binding subunit
LDKSISVKKPVGYNVHHFEKVGQRKSMACEAARLAWGSVGPTVVTAAVVEDALIGEKLSQEILATVAGRIRQIVAPINDVRATVDYLRTVSGNLLLRLLDARPQI